MEFYKVEPEFIDSLDFLSPPVKRIHNNRDVFVGPVYNSGTADIQVFSGLSHKHVKSNEKIVVPRRTVKTGAESSTSLILEKSSERQILDRYSIASYTNLHASTLNAQPKKLRKCQESKNLKKPLIRVTVIPKSDQAQTVKLLRKKRNTQPKRVQSTLSNQENSIQTKNVYLVVAGRRKDKIYEIKTTGSATFSSDQTDRNDKFSVSALANVKQLIQSLNMDQAKSRDIKQIKSDERQIFTNFGNNPYESEEFIPPHTNNLKTEKRSGNRSRLRIYGQLGVTDDDRYVLRYGALINDKPVSDFAQFVSSSPQDVDAVTRAIATRDDSILLKKDVNVQASYENVYEVPKVAASCFPYGETQGTQVNFNVHVSTKKRQGHNGARTTEKNTQCICNDIPDGKDTNNYLKECQSPLVIISVYPKSSPEDNTPKTAKSTSGMKRNLSPRRQKTTEAAKVPLPNKTKVDRSPDRRHESKKDLLPHNRSKADRSPDRRPAAKKDSRKDILKRNNEDTKKEVKKFAISRSPSPVKKRTEINTSLVESQIGKKPTETNKTLNTIKKNVLDKPKDKSDGRNIRKYNYRTTQQVNKKTLHNSQLRSNEIGINTEQAKTKKVNSRTKTQSEQRKQKDNKDVACKKSNSSKVRIDIDGENEYYNVLVGQGKLSTDVRIEKKMKPTCSNKCCGNLSNSLENICAIPTRYTTVHPMSIAVYKPVDDIPQSDRFSGMTIRDSLEISHRRGDKNYNMKNTQTCYTAQCNDYVIDDTQYLAPIKHYIGDDCSIYDPIQRDREIRELLGVDKTKAHSSNDDRRYSCFYRRQCERNHIAQINLVKLCPCLQMTNNDDTDSTCIPEGCPEKCCPQAPCNFKQPPQQLKPLDMEPETPNWCQQDDLETTNTSDIKLSNYSTCPNVIAAELQFHKQLQHQQQQLLQQQMRLQQQQQQQLHLQQQQQQLRVQQHDYKTKCGACCGLTNQNEGECCMANAEKIEDNDCFCESPRENVESPTIYQQLILNRNIQVFLQVDQFSKQRPIVLSRKQYEKVKKTIQSTLQSCRDKRKKILSNYNASNVSVGEVRKKTNIELQQSCNKEVQTDLVPCNRNICRKIAKKYRRKSKMRPKLQRNKLERCRDKRNEDESSGKECSPPPKTKQYRREEEYSSDSFCTSSCAEDFRRKRYERYQRPNYNRQKPSSRCCKPSGERFMSRRDPYDMPDGHCRQTTYPPSDPYYRAYRNNSRQQNLSCNAGHQKIPDGLCEPSGLLPQRNKADINLQRVVGEYSRICGEPVDLNIDQRFNAALPYQGNIPYKPSDLPVSYNITGPDFYKQYDDEIKGFTGVELPSTINEKTLGTLNKKDEHSVNRIVEKSLEASGYPTRIEQIGQREVMTFGKHDSQYELPHRLDADYNLLKTTSQHQQNSVQFEYRCGDREQKSTIMLYNATNNDNGGFMVNKTLSSMEIHYASMAFKELQPLDLSRSDLAVVSDSSIAHVQSFQTLFRGHKKSPTPNLGTSIYSLYSGEELRSEKSTTFIMPPKDVKPIKRPFLRRLMSCLVMRSARASELKLPTSPPQDVPSCANSSVDSYHISTSLGAVEISSSIYDTSASFYSNHTILPINSKIKRGFFSSVRGFLTNRKS